MQNCELSAHIVRDDYTYSILRLFVNYITLKSLRDKNHL